jgi:hypothetical protein
MRTPHRLLGSVLGLTLALAPTAAAVAAGPPAVTANRLAAIACLLAAAGVPLGGQAIVSDVDANGVAVLTLQGGVSVRVTYIDTDSNGVFTCGEPITSVTITPPA